MTLVYSPNQQPRLWNQNNPIESKSKQIMKSNS